MVAVKEMAIKDENGKNTASFLAVVSLLLSFIGAQNGNGCCVLLQQQSGTNVESFHLFPLIEMTQKSTNNIEKISETES